MPAENTAPSVEYSRRLQARQDQVARLEVPGSITSLNVSNATAIALYAASRRR